MNSESCLLGFPPCYSSGVGKGLRKRFTPLACLPGLLQAAGSFCHTSLKPTQMSTHHSAKQPPHIHFLSIQYQSIQRTRARRNLCFSTNGLRVLIIMENYMQTVQRQKDTLPHVFQENSILSSERVIYFHIIGSIKGIFGV